MKMPLSSSDLLLMEYQVYLSGVVERNPLKLRNCISFHETSLLSLRGAETERTSLHLVMMSYLSVSTNCCNVLVTGLVLITPT